MFGPCPCAGNRTGGRTRQGVSAVLSTNDGLRDRHAPGVALQRAASVSQCTNRGSGAGLHDGTTVNRPTIPAIRTSFHQTGVGRSEEHTSELQSLMRISYAVFCLKKK